MEKLELKHLSPYLPYGLKFRQRVRKATLPPTFYYKSRLMTPKNIDWLTKSEIQKPILRPLSDLSKDDLEFLANILQVTRATVKGFLNKGLRTNFRHVSYNRFSTLLEHHFDVFGLIEKGLAIDINTLEK